MGLLGMVGTWQRLKARATRVVVQDCPPALAACQVCHRAECPSAEWLQCRRRLAAERYLKEGNGAAVEQLRQGHGDCPVLEPGPNQI